MLKREDFPTKADSLPHLSDMIQGDYKEAPSVFPGSLRTMIKNEPGYKKACDAVAGMHK